MKYGKARAIVESALEQIDEATGDPAPYGYHVKKSPSGRKRYIPKTKEEWHKESEAFHKKNPHHWENVKRFQRANPLNPDNDKTGTDDHLPGGGAAALARSRAAFARKPTKSKR